MKQGSKKDRDMATQAFREWGLAGCPDRKTVRERGLGEDMDACAAVFELLAEQAFLTERGVGRRNSNAAEIMGAVRFVCMRERGAGIFKSVSLESLGDLGVSFPFSLAGHGEIHSDFGAFSVEVSPEALHDFLILDFAVTDMMLASPLGFS